MAEREGFEPSIPLRVCRISSAVLSTTQPPLHEPARGRLRGPAERGAEPHDPAPLAQARRIGARTAAFAAPLVRRRKPPRQGGVSLPGGGRLRSPAPGLAPRGGGGGGAIREP